MSITIQAGTPVPATSSGVMPHYKSVSYQARIFMSVRLHSRYLQLAVFRQAYTPNHHQGARTIRTFTYDAAHQLQTLATYTLVDQITTQQQLTGFFTEHENTHGQYLHTLPAHIEDLPLAQVSVYTYSSTGHRTSQYASDGSYSLLGWDALGYISSITRAHSTTSAVTTGTRGVPGVSALEATEHIRISCDASGAMIRATGNDHRSVPVVWDECASVPSLVGVGVLPASVVGRVGRYGSVGSVVGSGSAVAGSGFAGSGVFSRGAAVVPGVGSGAGLLNPYGVFEAAGSTAGVSGVQVSVQAGASGVLPAGVPDVLGAFGVVDSSVAGVSVAGFSVVGVRVADPVVCSFVSLDPLPGVVGSGWFGSGFVLVGCDPVGLVDPWGLSPVSVADLRKVRKMEQQATWTKTAAFAVGVATIFVSGPVGIIVMAALTGGINAISAEMDKQIASGKVGFDQGALFREGAIGAATGLITGGVSAKASILTNKVAGAQILERAMPTTWQKNVINLGKDTLNSTIESTVQTFKTKGLNPKENFKDIANGTFSGAANNAVGLGLTQGSTKLKVKIHTKDAPTFKPGAMPVLKNYDITSRSPGALTREAFKETFKDLDGKKLALNSLKSTANTLIDLSGEQVKSASKDALKKTLEGDLEGASQSYQKLLSFDAKTVVTTGLKNSGVTKYTNEANKIRAKRYAADELYPRDPDNRAKTVTTDRAKRWEEHFAEENTSVEQ